MVWFWVWVQIWGGVLDKFDLKEYKVILYDLMGAYRS